MEHFSMLILLVTDLIFKHVEKSFDVAEWATGFDLGLDLSEEVAGSFGGEAVEFLVGHGDGEGGSDEADDEYCGFHCIVDFYRFFVF